MIESLLNDHGPAVVAVAWLFGIGLIGGLLTEVGPWYEGLRFPRIRPPNWLFGPAWTTLYILIGIGGVSAWYAADSSQRWALLAVLGANTAFNLIWSPLFFKFRRPDWAFAELIPFWISVVAVIATVYEIKPEAAAFFVPYLLWVTFAGWLNWRIVELNRPFKGRDGVIADFILAGMAVEGVALAVYRVATGRGPLPFVANLLAGASILVAWRASASGASDLSVAAALAAAGLAHGLDLAARWRASARDGVPATIRWRAPRR